MKTAVVPLTAEHPRWGEAAAFAEASAWRAGPYLARRMRENAFRDWERVFLLEADGRLAGYCTLTARDTLPEKWGFSPFIGFVYVAEAFRGRRLSEAMIGAVMEYAARCGFGRAYLVSGEKGLYEKYGFRLLGEYETVFGTAEQLFVKETAGR